MKRLTALLLAALFLFSGCAKKAPSTVIEQSPTIEVEQLPLEASMTAPMEQPAQDEPQLMNNEYECALMLEFLNELCDVEDKSEIRLLYAKYSLPDDWEINPDVPVELYQYPYNIDCPTPLNPNGDFMSNKDFLSSYNQALQNELIAFSDALALFHANANGNSLNDDVYMQNALKAVCPAFLQEDIEAFKQSDIDNSFISDGKFLSDKSLIYIAVDGTMRVRGRLFTKAISFSDESTIDLIPGEWYYSDMEFVLLPAQTVCEWYGVEQWTNDELTVIGYIYLHQYWIGASHEQLAWLDAVSEQEQPMKQVE